MLAFPLSNCRPVGEYYKNDENILIQASKLLKKKLKKKLKAQTPSLVLVLIFGGGVGWGELLMGYIFVLIRQ